MGKNEPKRALERQQPFFVAYDGVVGVVVRKRIAFGVLVDAFFVLREV